MTFFSNTWINGASRHIGIVRLQLPTGKFKTIHSLYYKEPIGGSTALMRYQKSMDGQDDFALRGEYWLCVNPVIEVSFIGNTPTTTYFLFDGDITGTDRAYVFVNDTNGFLNSNATTMTLNGNVIATNTAMADIGEENHLELSFTGTYRVQVVGARYSLDQLFSPTPINAIRLTDPLDADNTFTTKFTGNGAFETAIGDELGVELWVPPFDLVDTGWTDNGDGSYTCDGSQVSTSQIRLNNQVTINEQVLCGMEVVSVSGGDVHMGVGNDATVNQTSVVGSFSGLGASTSADPHLRLFADAGVSCTVKSVSFKSIGVSAFTHENGEPDGSDFELITRKSDNSGFVGVELWDFDAMGSAALTVLTQVSTGFSFDGTAATGDAAKRCFVDIETIAGSKYLMPYSLVFATGAGSGSLFARAGTGGNGTVLATTQFDDDYIEFTATSGATTILFAGDAGVEEYGFDGLSIKSQYDFAAGAIT